MSDKPASPARGRKKTAPPAQQPPQEEVVVRLPLTDLHPFPDHPFQVRDDEEMRETIQSVKEYGVIVPAIVRPREEGGYEIVAGHRRKYACEQAGLDTMPVLIRNLDRDAATIIMVDSNLQRENILPSERANYKNLFLYTKMRNQPDGAADCGGLAAWKGPGLAVCNPGSYLLIGFSLTFL